MRVNIEDQKTATGEGGFHVGIQVWGKPRYRGYVSFTAPEPIAAGGTRQIDVSLYNGGSEWNPADGYRLAPVEGTGQTWSVARVPLSAAVPAGSSRSIQMSVTAPTALGSYPMGWRLTGGPAGRLDLTTPLHTVQVVTSRCAELADLIAGLDAELALLAEELRTASGEERKSLEREVRKAENKLAKAEKEARELNCPR